MEEHSQNLKLLEQYLNVNNKIKNINLAIVIRIQVLKNRQIFRKMEINGKVWNCMQMEG